jgi:5-epi-alpha-selinene synthase
MVVPRGDAAAGDFDEREEPWFVPASPPLELYCPFVLALNAHAAATQRRSIAWAKERGLVSDDASVSRLEKARIGQLEAFVFPDAPAELLDFAAQWTTLFCVVDDFVEDRRLGPLKLASYLSNALAGFRGERLTKPDPIARAFMDLRSRLVELQDRPLVERFAFELEALFGGFVWEELNRRHALLPEYGSYRAMRAITVGLRPQFLLAELLLAEHDAIRVRQHPVVQELELLTCCAVGWANDVFTYEKEIEAGEVHNVVVVLMDSEALPVYEAVSRARSLHDREVRSFLAVQARLRSLESDNAALEAHLSHLRHWMRGHLEWAARTGRYRPPSEVLDCA